MRRVRTKYPGIFERKSDVRKFNGKPDVCFDIAYRDQGRLVWEKVGWLSEGYSAKLAEQVRGDRIRAIRHEEELPQQKKKVALFKEIAGKYLEWAKENKTRQGRDDISRYENHLKPRFDDKKLNEVSPLDLERMKSELTKAGLSQATIKHCLVLFRQIYNKAIAWGLWNGENPVKKVKLPTLQNQRERFLSFEEANILLNALNGVSKTIYDMALISLHCGLRAGEMFSLKEQHIDLQNGIITISDPKNKTARKVFMTNAIKEILKARIQKQPGDYIFKDKRHGGKIESISHTFKEVVDSLKFNKGIDDPRQRVTFHSLRHTFASWLALQGESLMTIRELLGHKSFAMTQRYSHLIPDEKKRATMNLEKLFNQKKMGLKVVKNEA
jgi:integrase